MEFVSNPCIRCGKERIKGTERIISVSSAKAKLTTYICPDKSCQKIVDAQLAAKEERRLAFTQRRNQYPPRKKAA
ncbi:MAG: hypothetical protein Q8O75_02070 [bacterium]|nr:hypothetical protein [bacterium]